MSKSIIVRLLLGVILMSFQVAEANTYRGQRQLEEAKTEAELMQRLETLRVEDEKYRSGVSQQVSSVYNNEAPSESDFSLGLITGTLNYPDISNIGNINSSFGVNFGWNFGWNFSLEGEFLYSFQQSEINRLTRTDVEDIDHFMFTVIGRYNWMPMILPQYEKWSLTSGLVLTHSRRQFNADENASQGFDGGVAVGGSYDITSYLQAGIDYRYMMNMSYDRDIGPRSQDRNVQRVANGGSELVEIESFDYQLVLLYGKYLF